MTRYFDITDLVRFARANGNVSGIQRVQVRVLRHLANNRDRDNAICIYSPGRFSRLRACHARDLFVDEAFDAGNLLAQLGLEDPTGAFTKRELYEDLARYPKGSLDRALRKSQLIMLSRLSPSRARAELGLQGRTPVSRRVPPKIPTWPVRKLRRDDHLVMIGTNWNVSETEKLASRHGAAGGHVTQVVYDLIPYHHPEFFVESLSKKFVSFLDRARRFTSHYVCISESTRTDMQAYLSDKGTVSRVDAWPLAHEFEGYSRNDRTAEASDSQIVEQTHHPFVLCVGTIEVRKNGVALLRVWQKLIAEMGSATPLLVFAGKYGWKIDAFRQLLESDVALQQRVRIFSQPSDADLANLYQRCLFTAYPSLIEGWGLPVGEAAWFGKYSVVSSTSSLPEVCGNLVDYVAPTDLDGLARAIAMAMADNEYRRLREEAIARAKLRSWKDVADHFDHLLAVENAVSPNGPA